jgi:dienelactone hydrolase
VGPLYVREDLVLDNGAGARVPAALVLPRDRRPPYPAVLWQHSHFGDYAVGLEEIFQPWPVRASPAAALARRGFAVLAIDAYAFGGRRGQGPGGRRETGRSEETSLAKLFLWHGTSLWAMMMRDDRIALDYLLGRPEIDARRIGATGMSMGSTRTWWLAALDRRISAAVCVACLTRYQDLVRDGGLERHGIYYYVPGMLRRFDTEAVLALVAPRPLLTLTGDRDPGSPVSGVRRLNRFCERLYGLHGAADAFAGVVYRRLGHDYTRAMWDRMVGWFERHL